MRKSAKFVNDVTPPVIDDDARETFISGGSGKSKKTREKDPDWKPITVWLPLFAIDVLMAEASRKQFKKVPNFSLYTRDLMMREVEKLQRKAKAA